MVPGTSVADRIGKIAKQCTRSAVIGALVVGVAASCARERKADQFQLMPRDVSLQPLTPASAANVEFIGARSFNPEQLREPLAEQLGEIGAQGLTRPRADDTAYYLAVFYHKQGFADVEVNWEIRGSRLVLRIDEATSPAR